VSGLDGGLGLYERWKSTDVPKHRLLDVVEPYADRVDCGICNHAMDCWPHCIVKLPNGELRGVPDGCRERKGR
jgi:hypothetical protein